MIVKYWLRGYDRKFIRNKAFNTPIAGYKDLENAIIVYPEVTNGNPLNAKNVVRWFLHKPGFHTGNIDYGQDELYFFFQPKFNDPMINKNLNNLLQLVYFREDVYKNKRLKHRVGSCYMMRKGKGRKIVHDLAESVCIDGMTHEEIASIFNKVKYFISYDLYTMYNRFAALCGCITIVIPEENISEDEWQPVEELRYGIAYGFENIEYARKTQSLVRPYLKKQQMRMNKNVQEFILKCEVFFEKEIKVKYFLFGVRVFGYGSHQKQIEIPVTVRNDLIKVIRKRLEQLQMQLIDLINQ